MAVIPITWTVYHYHNEYYFGYDDGGAPSEVARYLTPVWSVTPPCTIVQNGDYDENLDMRDYNNDETVSTFGIIPYYFNGSEYFDSQVTNYDPDSDGTNELRWHWNASKLNVNQNPQIASLTHYYGRKDYRYIQPDIVGAEPPDTTPPSIPTSLQARNVGFLFSFVRLTWNASTDDSGGPVTYNVYRSNLSGGSYTKINTSPVTNTTYDDLNVLVGQRWYYVVTAMDSSQNESAYSNEASIKVR